MKLYTYYRSSAAYRVRIALNYKTISHELIPINLLQNQQKESQYKAINPHARIPTLIAGDLKLGQSVAILEYLEEKYPNPSILPASYEQRAIVRYLSQIIVSDMHPLNNSGTINFLKEKFNHTSEEVQQWYFYWLKNGFDALESIISTSNSKYASAKFCIGDSISMADICLVPQIYNAFRFGFDMQAYPTLLAINKHCVSLDYFAKASPENQPDFI